MATAFCPTKFIVTVPLHGSSENRFLPLILSLPPSSFLGSTRSFTLISSCRVNHANAVRRSPIVGVSKVVKEKKTTNSMLITKEEGLELYEDMVLGRSVEDMCAQMYDRGKVFGYVHLYTGQEAVATGFIKLLTKTDSVVTTYRDHVHALSKGVSVRAVMSELFGKVTGCCRGQGGSMHMFSKEHNMLGGFAFIGEGIPVATGAAFASKYKREVLKENCEDVAVAFFGDGTCNNGQFYECLNMAALWKLPIIFVVENNLWALQTSQLRTTSDPEIWKKGPAFGVPGVHVDGMDVLKVREVAKEAVTRARRGEGPTLVECETYRFRCHSLSHVDDLRDAAERAKYAAKDPITALKKYLIENKLGNEAELKSIEKKINEVVEEAVEFADASPQPDRSQLLENVFADPKGFGIGPNGRYKFEDPKFTEAGTDTSSSSVEWAMTELLNKPETMTKAQSEIRQVVGQNDDVQESHLLNLPYLNGVVKETLRLHPPVPFLLPHRAEADARLAGFFVPKNAQVLVNIWAIGRDPKVWENPKNFEPERFLSREIDIKGKDSELTPFGSGRRICPGMSLALGTVPLVLASLLHSFDWKLQNDVVSMDMEESFSVTLHKTNPLFAAPIKKHV